MILIDYVLNNLYNSFYNYIFLFHDIELTCKFKKIINFKNIKFLIVPMSEDNTFPNYFEKFFYPDNEIYMSKNEQFDLFSKLRKDIEDLDWCRGQNVMDTDKSSLIENQSSLSKKHKKPKKEYENKKSSFSNIQENQLEQENFANSNNTFNNTEIKIFNNNISLTVLSNNMKENISLNQEHIPQTLENIKNFYVEANFVNNNIERKKFDGGISSKSLNCKIFDIEKIERKSSGNSKEEFQRKISQHESITSQSQESEFAMEKSNINTIKNNNIPEMKVCIKLVKNRESAKKSRNKKKIYIKQLEEKYKGLQNELGEARLLMKSKNSGLDLMLDQVRIIFIKKLIVF